MEKLTKYMTKHGLRQIDLARAAGVHSSTALRLMAGSIKDPAVSLAVAVEKFTKGAVRCEDWGTQ